MKNGFKATLILLMVTFFMSGCLLPEGLLPSCYLEDVPFYRQASDPLHLATGIAMVMNYYEIDITPEEVDQRLSGENSCWSCQLSQLARENNLQIDLPYLSMEDIKTNLLHNIPLITILLNKTITDTSNQTRVIIGFNDYKNELILHDPSHNGGENTILTYQDFVLLLQSTFGSNASACWVIKITPLESI